MEVLGPGATQGIHGERDGPTSTDGQSDGKFGLWTRSSFDEEPREQSKSGACFQVPYPSSYGQLPSR